MCRVHTVDAKADDDLPGDHPSVFCRVKSVVNEIGTKLETARMRSLSGRGYRMNATRMKLTTMNYRRWTRWWILDRIGFHIRRTRRNSFVENAFRVWLCLSLQLLSKLECWSPRNAINWVLLAVLLRLFTLKANIFRNDPNFSLQTRCRYNTPASTFAERSWTSLSENSFLECLCVLLCRRSGWPTVELLA